MRGAGRSLSLPRNTGPPRPGNRCHTQVEGWARLNGTPCPPQVGYELKDEIERKFDKWQEPPPVKQVKPLPAPLDGQRKKRGGRR